jgi:hypothetical protein
MSCLVDLTGRRFGRLLVLERAENDPHGNARFRCLCVCGNETTVRGASLRAGATKSCGCLNREVRAVANRSRAQVAADLARMSEHAREHLRRLRAEGRTR